MGRKNDYTAVFSGLTAFARMIKTYIVPSIPPFQLYMW